jgi:hypothetical protein
VILNSRLAALTLRAFAFKEIRPVGAIDMPTANILALERPDTLIVVGSPECRLAQKALVVPIDCRPLPTSLSLPCFPPNVT